jgi:hypothetical protein
LAVVARPNYDEVTNGVRGHLRQDLSVACVAVDLKLRTNRPERRRQAVLEGEQTQKSAVLEPYVPSKGERLIDRVENVFVYPTQTWHPFFENAYRGGGFAAGLGYMWHATSYSYVDIRGSYSIKSYKRAEIEFVSPRLFNRRGELSLLGGWRAATEVGFYGVGIDTSVDNRVNYGFERPYGGALLTGRPTRRLLLLRGGLDYSKWDLKSGTGGTSIEDVYTPETLPGRRDHDLSAHQRPLDSTGGRPRLRAARQFYGVTAHDYNDRDDLFGFRQLDYGDSARSDSPRSLGALISRPGANLVLRNQQVPFFICRRSAAARTNGLPSWRFRDHNSVLHRPVANHGQSFLDTAFLRCPAGRLAKSDLNLDHQQRATVSVPDSTRPSTVLRIDVAKSRKCSIVFATSVF